MHSGRWRDDHEKKVETLLDRADIQGYLTIEDLMEVFPDGDDDVENLSIIMLKLKQQGVEIFDQESLTKRIMKSEEDTRPIKRASLEQVSTDDTVGLYLKEMSLVPLLSLEEEQSLAKRIEAGRSARIDLANLSEDSVPGRQDQLRILMKEGEQAWEHLIKANTRLVVSVAKKYMGRGVPFLDLIQEGMACKSSGSSMTIKCQGCSFFAEGACMAALSKSCKSFSETGSCVKSRTLRRVKIASRVLISHPYQI